MDFVYSYKTADGVRHMAEMSAPNRDAVFAALRLQGIRPIKVIEAKNSQQKSSYVSGWALRTMIVAVSAITGALLFQMFYSNGRSSHIETVIVPSNDKGSIVALPRPRGQIIGFKELDISAVFSNSSEVYLARYAQPGIPLCENGRSPGLEEDLINCLKRPILIFAQDSDSIKELKRIVTGIKNDIALLLASGRGLSDILTWLDARQKMEATYRERIINDGIRHASSREDINHLLHTLGLEELPRDTDRKK